MQRADEVELFDYLSRHKKFREWVESKLSSETSVLMQAIDVDQLRKAQGRAGILKSMLDLLEQAPSAAAKQT